MYTGLYCRMARGIAPFHNKVLRFNYDLPLQELIKVLKVITDKVNLYYKPDSILRCRDLIEYNGSMTEEAEEIESPVFSKALSSTECFRSFYHAAIAPCKAEPGMKLGLSGKNYDWYLRLFIEDECNLNPDEPLSGNLELYTTDTVIKTISDNETVNSNGHLLVHGAKKYLEEIIAE